MNPQYSNRVFIISMVAIFYFLLIRPQQKRTRAHRAMLDALVPGVSIVTIGGIYATVVEVGERVRVRVYDGTEIEIAQAAVSRIVDEPKAGTSIVSE